MGMATAETNKWGRVRIRSDFVQTLREESGDEVFVTSTDDENIRIYSQATWHKLAGVNGCAIITTLMDSEK